MSNLHEFANGIIVFNRQGIEVKVLKLPWNV